ncbi:LOW QUALITY PROTEIN: calreticulin-3 [Alca torda]
MNSELKADLGRFKLMAGKFYGDPVDKSLQTYENSKFYAMSSRCKPFSNRGNLVSQYTVKHEKIACGGGYVKIFSSTLYQKNLSRDSHYYIMFGESISLLLKNWHCCCAKINDPTARKPTDWDDRIQTDDPNDKPELICSPYFALLDYFIPTYAFDIVELWTIFIFLIFLCFFFFLKDWKGEWKPRQIDNPNYRGVWPHPQIDNPNYSPDSSVYRFENISIIGLDIWQVRAGTVFDKFLITDDEVYAEDFGDETWGERNKSPEKEMNIKQSEEEQEREGVKEEKYFEQRFKKKLERKKECGKGRAVRNTVEKEEL